MRAAHAVHVRREPFTPVACDGDDRLPCAIDVPESAQANRTDTVDRAPSRCRRWRPIAITSSPPDVSNRRLDRSDRRLVVDALRAQLPIFTRPLKPTVRIDKRVARAARGEPLRAIQKFEALAGVDLFWIGNHSCSFNCG